MLGYLVGPQPQAARPTVVENKFVIPGQPWNRERTKWIYQPCRLWAWCDADRGELEVSDGGMQPLAVALVAWIGRHAPLGSRIGLRGPRYKLERPGLVAGGLARAVPPDMDAGLSIQPAAGSEGARGRLTRQKEYWTVTFWGHLVPSDLMTTGDTPRGRWVGLSR